MSQTIRQLTDLDRQQFIDEITGIVYAMKNSVDDHIKFDEYIDNIQQTIEAFTD